MKTDHSNLKRARNPMPGFVRQELIARDLMADFENRPAYQQNDYIGWITRAKRQETRTKRIQQMLDELRAGNIYMKMDWHGRKT